MRLALLAALVLALAACQTTDPPDDYAGEMRHEHDGDTPTPTGATAGDHAATGEAVAYATVGGQAVTGYLARPDGASAGPLPAVLVIHEWWGLNDNVKAMTRRLAAQGYTALAVDLYGGRVAATPDEAMTIMRSTMGDEAAATENLRQAYAFLAGQKRAPRVGVIGWCFGGMWSLRTALALPTQIDATVLYYGRPVTDPDALNALKMPVLGLFGGADPSIPEETVDAFDLALTQVGVPHEIVIYPGAAHAFANPSGQAYNPAAAEDAWTRTTAFLAEHLKGR